MICIDNKLQLDFSNMGLFATDAPWTHPTVTIDTYEFIYVLEGEVRIREGEHLYTVSPGQGFLLIPGTEHGGFGGNNTGRTSFYWLHFYSPDIGAWNLPKQKPLSEDTEKELRALMHDAQTDRRAAELRLAALLLRIGRGPEHGSRQIHEVLEYLRLHAAEPLTVEAIAARFGYSADHLSRLWREEFGYPLKTGIVKARLAHCEALLLNTGDSVKSIAHQCGFEDENVFVKFFRYHEGLTPTGYRNRFFRIHRNEK